jgi:hypothetical protein
LHILFVTDLKIWTVWCIRVIETNGGHIGLTTTNLPGGISVLLARYTVSFYWSERTNMVVSGLSFFLIDQ